jgi:hypothetical protein
MMQCGIHKVTKKLVALAYWQKTLLKVALSDENLK